MPRNIIRTIFALTAVLAAAPSLPQTVDGTWVLCKASGFFSSTYTHQVLDRHYEAVYVIDSSTEKVFWYSADSQRLILQKDWRFTDEKISNWNVSMGHGICLDISPAAIRIDIDRSSLAYNYWWCTSFRDEEYQRHEEKEDLSGRCEIIEPRPVRQNQL